MSFGLIINNASGQLIVDLSDYLGQIVLSASVSLIVNQTIVISVPGILNNGKWPIYTDLVLQFCNLTYLTNSIQLTNAYSSTITGRVVVFKV